MRHTGPQCICSFVCRCYSPLFPYRVNASSFHLSNGVVSHKSTAGFIGPGNLRPVFMVFKYGVRTTTELRERSSEPHGAGYRKHRPVAHALRQPVRRVTNSSSNRSSFRDGLMCFVGNATCLFVSEADQRAFYSISFRVALPAAPE